jgi:hypothetical protein
MIPSTWGKETSWHGSALVREVVKKKRFLLSQSKSRPRSKWPQRPARGEAAVAVA